MTQHGQKLVLATHLVLHAAADTDVANVALRDVLAIHLINAADKLDLGRLALPRLERQVVVADVALRVQFLVRHLARRLVPEEAELPQFLADDLLVRVLEQLGHERVGIYDLLRVDIENEDAVLCGLEQTAIAALGGLKGDLGTLVLGDVLDGEQEQALAAFHRREPAGVEQHDFRADRGERVLHFEIVNGIEVLQDSVEQRPQTGDIPLTVAEVVNELALRFHFRDAEGEVERAIRGHDVQTLVEHNKRFAQRGNDILGVRERIFRLLLTLPALANVTEHLHGPGELAVLMPNGSGTAVDWTFRAVFRDENATLRDDDGRAVAQHPRGGTLNGLTAVLVENAEHALERLPHGVLHRPATQGFRNDVEQRDPALDVGGNHAVTDAREDNLVRVRAESSGFYRVFRHGEVKSESPQRTQPSHRRCARVCYDWGGVALSRTE